MFITNKFQESVGKMALIAGLVSVSGLGIMLADKHEELSQAKKQLDKANERIVIKETVYSDLEEMYSVTLTEKEKLEADKKKLLQLKEEANKEASKLGTKNQELNTTIAQKENEIDELKKNKADAEVKRALPDTIQISNSNTVSAYKDWKLMKVEATGYSLNGDSTGSDGTPETATGTYPKAGRTIAVDPKLIPYGTEVYIPAFNKVFIAEDCGGLIKGNKIDIYMNHGDEARQWGRQTIEIYVNN